MYKWDSSQQKSVQHIDRGMNVPCTSIWFKMQFTIKTEMANDIQSFNIDILTVLVLHCVKI